MKNIKKTLFIAGIIIGAALLFVYSQSNTIKTEQNIIESKHIAWQKFKEKAQDENTVVIDIRTADEYNAGKLFPDAITDFDFYQTTNFDKKVSELDKDKTYLIYCRSGNRTGQALKVFEKYGIKAYDLDGGHNITPVGSLK